MAAHGTTTAYSAGCHCKDCKRAWRNYVFRRKRERMREGIPDTVEHGLVSTYNNWNCRCWKCSTAQYVRNEINRDRYESWGKGRKERERNTGTNDT